MTLIGHVDVEMAQVYRFELPCLERKLYVSQTEVIILDRDPHLFCASCLTDSFGVHGQALLL